MSEKEPDYSFFNNFASSYKIECERDQASYTTIDAYYCEGPEFQYNVGNQVEGICKNMVKLYNHAILNQQLNKNVFSQKKVPEFINYWINSHLTKAGIKDIQKPQIFQKFDAISKIFDQQSLLKGKIYHIKEKEVDGMNILYELYKNIYELEQKEKNYFETFLKIFKKHYNQGLIKCFNEGNVKFCQELNKYREFYEGNKKKELSEICDNKECPSLTELTLLASASKKEHLNIAEIGSKLIKGSDISSLNGLSFLETEDYSKLKDLISLQYNLRMEKDEDEKNSVMLEILYQYLKYCNKHNNIWYLEQFINEFINKYYNKEEKYYEKLFTNCKSEQTQTKVYCTYYKQCKSEFNKDFTLIENDIGNYKESIKEHFKKLTPDISLIQKALDLFKDFDSILRNSPTIMSTLIAVFLCLFFLYKLTTLSSIFRKEKKKRKIPLFYPQRIIQDVKVDNSGHNNPKPKGGKIRFAYQPS
ncbi:PIR protein [Plasmodium vivax]|uniref:VIR protein n=1 Tax=Plasmodium vivax TaxID=5855 RepID=A0A564ZQB6_PLAVI|nr:PIR protein [Plasmodium vivax]